MSQLFSDPSDLEDFAEYLGLDYDQFYESYYQVHYDETDSDSGALSLSICDDRDAWERQTRLSHPNILSTH